MSDMNGRVALVTGASNGIGKATAISTDVSAAKDVERMLAHAIATFGRLDYAVNNAGIEGRFAAITGLAEEDWDRVLDINLRGAFLCLKYEARAILNCGNGGAIVSVGSINSFLGFPSGSAVFLCSDEASYIAGSTLTPDGGFTPTI